MKKIFIATSNKNKIKEFSIFLKPLGYEIKTLLDLDKNIDIEETGLSYEENALLKSEYIFKKLGIPVMSDDSGFEVEALDWGPGIYSHRFLGNDTSYEKKNEYIIKKAKETNKFGAKYISVISYIDEKGNKHFFRGELIGVINLERKGENGFAYDSIFYYPPLNKTLAEISLEEKNKISARGKSIKKLANFIAKGK